MVDKYNSIRPVLVRHIAPIFALHSFCKKFSFEDNSNQSRKINNMGVAFIFPSAGKNEDETIFLRNLDQVSVLSLQQRQHKFSCLLPDQTFAAILETRNSLIDDRF